MRINKFLALGTGLSRRAADQAVQEGRVRIDGEVAQAGSMVNAQARVTLDNKPVKAPVQLQTVLFHKPVNYVVSRDGQGNRTIYELLPPELHHLKPVGRLDRFSSGLLLLTNDGALAQELTHPSRQKIKIYELELTEPLQPLHRQMIGEIGVQLEDGRSVLNLERLHDGNDTAWRATMYEGRNRQIRRTFAALGYHVKRLHRVQFGSYVLGNLPVGEYTAL